MGGRFVDQVNEFNVPIAGLSSSHLEVRQSDAILCLYLSDFD